MAGESCSARLLRRVSETALLFGQPARYCAGSVDTAVFVISILVGAYDLVLGSVYYIECSRYMLGMKGLVMIAACLAFITAFTDAVLVFGILRKKNDMLHTIVCISLTAYMLCTPIPLSVIIGLAYNNYWVFQLWEVPRLVCYPLHVCLMYCLLVELRQMSPPFLLGDGWLKSNLTQQASSGLKSEEVLLKVHAPGAHGPATFAPSSCTTAAPVHGGLPAPSGPLSSSEA